MLITFEGIEGSGKTTQIKHVARYFQKIGKASIMTREPGGTNIGTQIRTILLDSRNKGIDPISELLLYMADRVQHAREVILPGLASGKLVLCDRFFDATLVYQGFARGLDTVLIRKLHQMMLDNLTPGVTILLDLPPKIGLSRAWKQINQKIRSGSETRFEEEMLSFHEKVRSGYLTLAQVEPERFSIVDAALGEEQVREDILVTLKEKLHL
jgi:dTMP kinase